MKVFLKRFIFVCLVAVFFTAGNAYALGTDINLKVKVGSRYLYNSNISVLSCDSDNNGSADDATAYCALSQSGLNLGGSWSEYGYFLESINNISGYPNSNGGDYHYWAFYTNGEYASVGANSYLLKSGDVILFDFTDPSADDISKVKIKSGGILIKDTFSIKNGVDFLSKNQEEDGSFGNSIYTDWVAIGIAKTKEEKTEDLKSSIVDYIKNEKFVGKSITDYERHAMALMSLGINPYNGTKINYIEKIVNSFDGEQIGDEALINDDIFGLIVLQNSGYTKDDAIILKIISNILKNQSINGSWGSVDMTSAGVMALDNFKDDKMVQDSIFKAFKFIKGLEEDGNFGNTFSSSWAMQSFSLRDYYSDEIYRILKFLTHEQDNENGFMKEEIKENRIWATAYAIPAVLKMSWVEIMESFPKQEVKIYPKDNLTKIKNKTKEEIIEIPAYENSDITSTLLIDANKFNMSNFFQDKFAGITIVLTLALFVWGWFVIKS